MRLKVSLKLKLILEPFALLYSILLRQRKEYVLCIFCILMVSLGLLAFVIIIFLGSSRPPSPASFSLEGRKPAEVGCIINF